MILLDTHIWYWLIALPHLLSRAQRQLLEGTREQLVVSAFSLLEIAQIEGRGRISLPLPIDVWFSMALEGSSISVIEITPQIAIESTRLPKPFHKDPADRIIVATSRILDIPLVTSDGEILKYEYVRKLP